MPIVSRVSQVDVRDAQPHERRSSTLLAYQRLQVGDAMEVLDGQDPVDLYGALQAIAPGDFSWLCVERRPGLWRISVRKLGRIYSAGECCGVCGGADPRSTMQIRSNPADKAAVDARVREEMRRNTYDDIGAVQAGVKR